jgi:hypothetical protein
MFTTPLFEVLIVVIDLAEFSSVVNGATSLGIAEDSYRAQLDYMLARDLHGSSMSRIL